MKEILYCNLTVIKDKKQSVLKECVYLDGDIEYKGMRVIKVEIIKSLGFSQFNNGFNEIAKSDEKRNKITGAYE